MTDAQVIVFPDGHTAGSYKVHFDKVKKELIPDILDQIPDQIMTLLPDTFNLYIEGDFTVIENEISVPEKLDSLEVGNIALQPLIGEVSNETRAQIFDYAERIYKQIPELMIHSLKTNAAGNFEISAYMPTQLVLTHK